RPEINWQSAIGNRQSSVTAIPRLRRLDQLNLISLRRVDERKHVPGRARRRAVGKLQSELRQVLLKLREAVHLERQMSQVRLHLDRSAAGKERNLDLFLAL